MLSLMWESGWIKYTWERGDGGGRRRSGDIIETWWGVTDRDGQCDII